MDLESKKNNSSRPDRERLLYGVEDIPSPPLCFTFGLQQAILCLGGPLAMSFVYSGLICAKGQNDVILKLLSTSIFMCGVATILQTMFGIRLGIIQASSSAFIAPTIAMMTLPKWKCPDITEENSNGTDFDDDIWKSRMREIQGNLILASLTQVLLGCTGLAGLLMRFVGPLTVSPTLVLLSLSIIRVVIDLSSTHWGIAFLSAGLVLLFDLYLGKISLPVPAWSRNHHCYIAWMPMFQLFTILFSIGISWLFCFVLTITDVFPTNSTATGYKARTDVGVGVIERAPWFYLPYPLQFGTPTFSVEGYVGFLVATMVSVLESVGDYYAAARVSDVPVPPLHAINRGIAMEGIASVLSGLVGAGHATTSYSNNIAAISITKVASRAVFVTAGVILLSCGVVGKFGAALTMIPDPIVGGSLAIPVGMIGAVGISTLKSVDLDSSRNLSIIGTSLFLGLLIPQYINDQANAGILDTGSSELDNILRVLLGTPMFVGGVVGCLLDNTAPGTDEQRGILSWRKEHSLNSAGPLSVYDFPFLTKYVKRIRCCSYVPVSPSYSEDFIFASCKTCRWSKSDDVKVEENHGQFYKDRSFSISTKL